MLGMVVQLPEKKAEEQAFIKHKGWDVVLLLSFDCHNMQLQGETYIFLSEMYP